LQFVVANSFLIANIIKHLGVTDGDFGQICWEVSIKSRFLHITVLQTPH